MIDGIEGSRRIPAERRAEGARPGRGCDFRVPRDASPAKFPGIGASSPASLAGMIALQGEFEADGPARDRRARNHGQDLLRRLTALQRAMLFGRINSETLRELATLAQTVPPTADPHLHAALAAIQLRASVELARLGMMTGQE
jgi:hypothetical protein